jgi:hypothetical protein
MVNHTATTRTSILAEARRRFDHWRRNRGRRGRIPVGLWQIAVEAATVHGVHGVARHLRLNATTLKKQMQRRGENRDPDHGPRFVELPWLQAPPTAECILEAEDQAGRKLRIHLKGQATAQAGSLGRMLWRDEQ